MFNAYQDNPTIQAVGQLYDKFRNKIRSKPSEVIQDYIEWVKPKTFIEGLCKFFDLNLQTKLSACRNELASREESKLVSL